MKVTAVIFGGKSTEHDISVISALQVIKNLDTKSREILPIYIARDGRFFTGNRLFDLPFYGRFDEKKVKEVAVLPNSKILYIKKGKAFRPWKKLDFAFLVLHGLNGEDGTVQSLFELNGVPYSSSGVLASAIGMDKVAMKTMFKGLELPILPYLWFFKSTYQKDEEVMLTKTEATLPYPMVVKPANLGSSIGISVCHNREELQDAVDTAASFDTKIVVEKAITKLKEVNVSCMGFGDEVECSVTEEPVNWESFLSFDDKYMNHKPSKRKMPANITAEQEAELIAIAKKVFTNFFCKGIVRIDFMIDGEDNKLYINEINTIPGSLAFFLWKDRGYDFTALLEKSAEYALKDSTEKNALVYQYASNVLKDIGGGTKKSKA